MAYSVQIYNKNWKTQRGSDGTLNRTLTHATDIAVRRTLNSPEQITFQVPRNSDDASALEIGRVVRIMDGTDVVGSGIVVGPLDKTRVMIPVTVAGKAEILNWSVTPYEYELEGTTAEAQVRELLKNYRFFRRNTAAGFNAGTHSSTKTLTVAGDPDEYFITLTETNDVYSTSGTWTSAAILLTDDSLGDPDDIARLRYLAELGNATSIKVQFRYSNDLASATPSNWSSWSSEYELTTENTEKLGLTSYSISADFRWIQCRFKLATTDTSITPALQAFEIVAEYPGEISAGTISLSGTKLDKTFSFESHHQAIREIVSARNAEFSVNDDYELDIAERFGKTTPTETFTVGTNCNVVRYEMRDRRLSTEIWSFGKGRGLAQELISTVDAASAVQKYGARPWVYSPQATTDSERTTEITNELALRDTPTVHVVIDELSATPRNIKLGDNVTFVYAARSINTTLRVIGIQSADPRKGHARQIELESNEGFFHTEIESEEEEPEEEEPETLEWDWFPIIDIFTDDSGNFSGVAVYDLEDNIDNPSDANVTLSVTSKSASLTAASINNSGHLTISVAGISANTTGNVVVRATATLDGVQREVEEQINFRLVYSAVDLSNYVTKPAITEFVTAGVTSGLVTSGAITQFVTAGVTSGLVTAGAITRFVTAGVTSGLVTQGALTAATSGLVTAGVTSGLVTAGGITNFVTKPAITQFVTAGVTSGLVTAGAITQFVTAGVTSGLVTAGGITNFVTKPAITQFVTAGVTNGLVTAGAITQFVTAGVTSGLVTAGGITNFVTKPAITQFVTAGVTNGLVTAGAITQFVTAGVTSGLLTAGNLSNYVTKGAITQFVTAGVTSGLVTAGGITNFVTKPAITKFVTAGVTSGLVTAGAITRFVTAGVTSGLVTQGALTAATSGLVTAGVTSGLVTAGGITNFVTKPAITKFVTAGVTSGLVTAGAITRFVTAGVTSGLVTQGALTAATSGLVTAGVTSGLVTAGGITNFVTKPAITQFVTAGVTNGLVTAGAITQFVTAGVTSGLVTAGGITNFVTKPAITQFVTAGVTNGLVTAGAITQFVTAGVTSGLVTAGGITNFVTKPAITQFLTSGAITNYVTSAISQFVTAGVTSGLLTAGAITQFLTSGAITNYVTSAISQFVTAGVTSGLLTAGAITQFLTSGAITNYVTSAISQFVTAGVTSGLLTAGAITQFLTSGAITNYVTSAISQFVTAGATSGLVTSGGITQFVSEGNLFSEVSSFISNNSAWFRIVVNNDKKKLEVEHTANFYAIINNLNSRITALENA